MTIHLSILIFIPLVCGVLAAFTPREQRLFLDLLGKFIAKFNATTRVPLDQRRSHPKRAKVLRRSR